MIKVKYFGFKTEILSECRMYVNTEVLTTLLQLRHSTIIVSWLWLYFDNQGITELLVELFH